MRANTIGVALLLACLPCPLAAVDWHVGPAFERALAQPTTILWEQVRLRTALDSLAESQRVCYFLDRRIDPDQAVSLDVANLPLDQVFTKLSESIGCGVGRVSHVVYLGPPATAAVLDTAAELLNDDVRTSAGSRARALMRPEPLRWPRLTVPRTLVEGLALEAHAKVASGDAIAYDLWDSVQMPPLTWGERLTLVLAGYHRTARIDWKTGQLEIVPLPRRLAIAREYQPPGDPNRLARVLAKSFPQAFLRVEGTTLHVRSTMEDQRRIRELIDPQNTPASRTPRKAPANRRDESRIRYTLTVQDQPIVPLLEGIAQRVDRTLVWETDREQLAAVRVSFEVKQVPLEGLLEAAIADHPLRVEIDETTIRILPTDGSGTPTSP